MNVLSGERPLSQGGGIKICTIKLFHIIFDRGGDKCLFEPPTSRSGGCYKSYLIKSSLFSLLSYFFNNLIIQWDIAEQDGT